MSEQSGTPRTDAVTVKILSSLQSGTEDVVYADFARTLEHEAATLREQLAEARRERDEAASRADAEFRARERLQFRINELEQEKHDWANGEESQRERAESAERRAAENEKDARRHWVVCTLFHVELERLLRSHLGVAGGSVDTLCDTALAAIDTALASESGGKEG